MKTKSLVLLIVILFALCDNCVASGDSSKDDVPASVKKTAKQLSKEGWKVIGDDSLAGQLWYIQKLKATKNLGGDLHYLISEGEGQDYDYENAVEAAMLNATAMLAGLIESQISSVSTINNDAFFSKVIEKASIDYNKVKTIMTIYKKNDSMYRVRVYVALNVLR